MTRRQRLSRVLLILTLAAGVACGTTENKAAEQPSAPTVAGAPAKQGGVFRNSIGEPATLDPYNASEVNGNRVIKRLFVGLTTFDENPDLVVRPGVAERWSSAEDCRQWTFNLRRSKFSNGEDVTAESFIRAWTRAADGRAASRVAGHLAGIQGYDELHGTASSAPTSATFSGLSAPDPHTLVVRLNAADCEFDKKTLHSVYSPVPSVAGSYDNRAFAEAPIGNGAFMIKPGTKWEHDKGISLVRSDSYFGPKPNIDGIEFVITPAQTPAGTSFRAFEAGELDMASPSTGQRRQADATYGPKGGFVTRLPYALSYLRVNVKAQLSEPDARRAVSMALDRPAIGEAIGEGYWEPATALVPPPFGNFHQPGVCDACRLDPGRAKELATRSGLTPGTRLRLLVATNAATNPFGQAIKDQLEKNLDIVVDLESRPLAEALAKHAAGEYDIASFSWSADYPTVDNFLFPLLARGSAENTGGYDNAEFNTLIQQARTQRNDAERKRLYQSAERLAIGRDVALIPGWFQKTLVVFDAERWTPLTLDFFGHPNYDTLSLK